MVNIMDLGEDEMSDELNLRDRLLSDSVRDNVYGLECLINNLTNMSVLPLEHQLGSGEVSAMGGVLKRYAVHESTSADNACRLVQLVHDLLLLVSQRRNNDDIKLFAENNPLLAALALVMKTFWGGTGLVSDLETSATFSSFTTHRQSSNITHLNND